MRYRRHEIVVMQWEDSWARAPKGFSTLLVMLQFLLKLGDAGLQLRPLFDQFPDNRSCYWKFLSILVP